MQTMSRKGKSTMKLGGIYLVRKDLYCKNTGRIVPKGDTVTVRYTQQRDIGIYSMATEKNLVLEAKDFEDSDKLVKI